MRVRHMPCRRIELVEERRQSRVSGNRRKCAGRITHEFELAADEDGACRVECRPVKQRRSLAAVLAELTPFDEDFPDIDDPPTEPEDPFSPSAL